MRQLPIQRLARPRAVVDEAAHRAPPELVATRLPPPAPSVGAESLSLARRRSAAPEPFHQEPVRRVRLWRRQPTPIVAQKRVASGRGQTAFLQPLGPGGGDGGRELPGVGLHQETPARGGVAADAVAVLEAVAEFPESVDVAEERRAGTQGDAGAEILVSLGAAAAVELYDRQRVKGGGVGTYGRLRHQRSSASPVL